MDEKQKPLFDLKLAATLLEKAYAAKPDKEKENIYKETWAKLTHVLIDDGFLHRIIQPFFSAQTPIALKPDEESEAGSHFMTISTGPTIDEFANLYRKMVLTTEEMMGTKRSIEDVKVEVTLFKGKHKHSSCRGNIRVTFTQGQSKSPVGYVTQNFHDFGFKVDVEAYSYGLPELTIPDVEERSKASPVYLVQAQQVKATFGKTVKESPEHIYLAAKWAGWSDVEFHGAQVLLIANVSIG